ncbi:uncharacterized protein BDW47DRAFT_104689 [Aspergillus candidus]|uniref:Uncharacterized protein n=1 Tax=Aspergillus candidus TaxID=41067 RepID=A0A2I2FDH8_ASPCN|nr:hypothetical protein BDW47DRAFT_104689 [Aspergillus candidus]PLB38688.1 hypothetical protein BDW47DRAFT_104689 [Aspergillus candidus]
MILPHNIHPSYPLLHTRSNSNPSDNTTQVIVGVVVGGVAVIAMTAGILIFFLKKRKRDRASQHDDQSLALHGSVRHGRKSRDDAITAQRPSSSLSFPHPIHTVGVGVDSRAHNQSPSPPPAYQPRLPVYDPSRYQRVDAPQHQMGWPSVPMPSHMQAHAYSHTQTQMQIAPTHLAPTHPTPNYLVPSQQRQQQQQRQPQHQQHQHQQYYLADGAPVPYPQPPLAVPHSQTNTNRFSFEPRQSWVQMAPEDVAVARAAQASSSPANSPPTGGEAEDDRPAGETQRPRRKRPVLSRLITNLG